ncbi:MAG: hypothetical protein ACLRSW_05840 [Christensenellaceae bacterium]
MTAIDQTRPIMRKSPVWRPSLIIPARPYGRDIMRENGRAKAPLSRFPRRRWWCAVKRAEDEGIVVRAYETEEGTECHIRLFDTETTAVLLRLKSRLFAFSGKSRRTGYLQDPLLDKNLGRRIIKSAVSERRKFNREKKFRMGRRDGVSDRGRLA